MATFEINLNSYSQHLQTSLKKMCDISNKLATHDRLLKGTEKQPTIIGTSGDVNGDRNYKHVSEVAFEVHRTITDMARRKCNIVVTGLPESTDEDENSGSDCEIKQLSSGCAKKLFGEAVPITTWLPSSGSEN